MCESATRAASVADERLAALFYRPPVPGVGGLSYLVNAKQPRRRKKKQRAALPGLLAEAGT